MSLHDRFRRAVDDAASTTGADVDLPSALMIAAARVLPVAGASLSVVAGPDRIPLGASDKDAARAEALQFTAGDGPCLSAIGTGEFVDAPAASLQTRWPVLAHLWADRTPYRSAASLPLHLDGSAGAAMNLFFHHAYGARDVDLGDAFVTASEVSLRLEGWWRAAGPDRAVAQGAAVPRGRVWVAAGMLVEAGRLTVPDAVDVLRGWCVANDTTIDAAARALVNRELSVTAVLAG